MGGGLFLLFLLSWWYLLAGAGMGAPHSMMHVPDSTRWTVMLLMWWIMMIAMMVPSAAPMVLLYAKVYRKGRESGRLPSPFVPAAAFAVGYLLVWLLFSLLAVAAQILLESSGLVHRMMMWSTSGRLSGSLLMLAGLYQLSPWKNRCLTHCRTPAAFLAAHWRQSAPGAVRMGVDHGLYCVGCCWSLMLLLFVVGVMNLAWIAVLSAVVIAEKLLPFGRWIARAAGAVLVAGGVWMLAATAG